MRMRPSKLRSICAAAGMSLLAGCGQPSGTQKSSAGTVYPQSNSLAARSNPNQALSNRVAAQSQSAPLEEGKLLVDPAGVDVFFLQYAISGASPDFTELANLDPAVQAANEFSRNATRARVEGELRARAGSVQGTTLLQVNLNDSFGEFDSKYREYDFKMGNGSVIPYFAVFGREVDLALTNGGLAQSWRLEPSEAEDILRRTGGDRNVLLVLRLQILNAPPAMNGAPMRINTRILEYGIRSSLKDIPLGKVVVGP